MTEVELSQQMDRELVQRVQDGDSAAFDLLVAKYQRRLMRLLVERIDFDGKDSGLDITFRDAGIRALANSSTGYVESDDSMNTMEDAA